VTARPAPARRGHNLRDPRSAGRLRARCVALQRGGAAGGGARRRGSADRHRRYSRRLKQRTAAMTMLVLGLVLFLGTHSVRIFADDWRGRRVAAMGANGWKGVYSLLSIAGFVLIVYGYAAARAEPTFVNGSPLLYAPPLWTRHLATLLVLPAFILLVAAYVPGTRIKRAVGHPMVAGREDVGVRAPDLQRHGA
jgi:hypothetical protein